MGVKKVTWIKSHPDFAYYVGDNAEMKDKAADKLIKSKHVKLFVGKQPKQEVIDLHKDLPGREALIANNLKTMKEVREIKDFTQIGDISKSMDFQIREFLGTLTADEIVLKKMEEEEKLGIKLPEDVPYRDALIAAEIKTLDQLHKQGDKIKEIKGFGGPLKLLHRQALEKYLKANPLKTD